MNPQWFRRPDWPLEHEEKRREAIIAAIHILDDGQALAEEDIEGLGLLLYHAFLTASDEELPRNRPASSAATDKELRRLVKLAENLAEHIEQMKRPSVSAVHREGADLFSLQRKLKEVSEVAGYSLGCAADENSRGAPPKVRAAEVTREAEYIFERVTGSVPKYWTEQSTVSGAWPEFLNRIFDALRIEASVRSQVSASAAEKSPKKSD